jgi:hypothetical protein
MIGSPKLALSVFDDIMRDGGMVKVLLKDFEIFDRVSISRLELDFEKGQAHSTAASRAHPASPNQKTILQVYRIVHGRQRSHTDATRAVRHHKVR